MQKATTESPANCCGDLLREVTRLYARAQREVADCCGTTSTQCHILIELGRAGELTPGELGRRLRLEKSWISRALDSLVDAGIVAKRAHADDARSRVVALTAKGRKRFQELNATLDAQAERVLAALSPEERAIVDRALALLLRALRADACAAVSCKPVLEAEGAA
ncbi:MAG: MarR family transcriptional regulator [Pseudomonadota bacterium]